MRTTPLSPFDLAAPAGPALAPDLPVIPAPLDTAEFSRLAEQFKSAVAGRPAPRSALPPATPRPATDVEGEVAAAAEPPPAPAEARGFPRPLRPFPEAARRDAATPPEEVPAEVRRAPDLTPPPPRSAEEKSDFTAAPAPGNFAVEPPAFLPSHTPAPSSREIPPLVPVTGPRFAPAPASAPLHFPPEPKTAPTPETKPALTPPPRSFFPPAPTASPVVDRAPPAPPAPLGPDSPEPETLGAAVLQSIAQQSSSAPAFVAAAPAEVAAPAPLPRLGQLERIIAETVSRVLVSDPLHDGSREVRVQFAREILPDTEVRLWRRDGRLHVEFVSTPAVAETGLRDALPRLAEAIQQRQPPGESPVVTLQFQTSTAGTTAAHAAAQAFGTGGQPGDGRSRQPYTRPDETEDDA